MTATALPYRSDLPTGRDGFGHLLRAEWTKFRTLRGWVIGTVVAGLVMVLLGFVITSGAHCSVATGPGGADRPCTGVTGPGGEAVTDSFFFVRQPLAGDGSITARISDLAGRYNPHVGARPAQGQGQAGMVPGLQPWSKAGIIVKAGTTPGSSYAALMVTGGHGVRLQSDFTRDTAGSAGLPTAADPRWLRLTRSGSTLTGEESTDGTHWTRVGTATLTGLPATVQAGLFAASPGYRNVVSQSLGGSTVTGGPTQATGVFDRVSLQGGSPGAAWTADQVGAASAPEVSSLDGFRQAGGTLTVSGSGDIAPAVHEAGSSGDKSLGGAFAGLIAVVVVGTMFITAEYRRGMIRTSFAATPRRGRVLAAKAVVLAVVTFAAGMVAGLIAVPLGERVLRANGNFVLPLSLPGELRLVAGTAGLLAVAAVLALALGAVLRRSAGAVTAVIVLIVLPYILATSGVLPAGPSDWLLRVTPAAAFAVQQGVPAYPQVDDLYTPMAGFFPLAPWAGFAVLCAWAVVMLAIATVLLRRRDA
jgi:ABC-type transport system involved in multi-copper enzyme maturation permease subunit